MVEKEGGRDETHDGGDEPVGRRSEKCTRRRCSNDAKNANNGKQDADIDGRCKVPRMVQSIVPWMGPRMARRQ